MKRTVIAAGTAALLLGMTVGVAAAAPAPAPAYTKQNLTTILSQWTHWTPDANDSSHAGTLNAGVNYFYCWTNGQSYYARETGRTSSIWLLTDDDTGHRNVYVSETYLDAYGYANDTQILPHC
ncbi:hypothetical protein ACFU6K_22105 [Kitasatospora sp. NPDC057512]|uniref:hypothetical protein n=1 Tax=Kitasatospora sp. NPDC057512 TaxID=3346154 RepID=UPI00369DD23F